MSSRPATSHVFGPVPSRRLGLSLGVDLVPLKTCTYDCVYCQLGTTTHKTAERREYVPVDEVLADVKRALEEGAHPDYVTLSGSGEPTLHSRIGDVIEGIKRLTTVPVAVLTNGSLLGQEPLVRELQHADLLVPSLDVGDAGLFAHVNRPHESISFGDMVEGLCALPRHYSGPIWLEILLLAGVTGIGTEVAKIRAIADRIRPDRIQLNTAVRPTAEDFAFALSPDQMARLARAMGPRAEVIADFSGTRTTQHAKARRAEVLALLRRRPCTMSDISAALGLHPNEVVKYVAELQDEGLVVHEVRGGASYCRSAAPKESVPKRSD